MRRWGTQAAPPPSKFYVRPRRTRRAQRTGGSHEAIIDDWSVGVRLSRTGCCGGSSATDAAATAAGARRLRAGHDTGLQLGRIYVGVNGGYGFGNSEWTNVLNAPTTTGTFDVNGFLVGPTLGANFQTGGFVFGIEADFDASWMTGTTSNAFCGVIAVGVTSCETKNTWLGTARARFGYAADRVLFYGTGGGAYGSIQSGVAGASKAPMSPAGPPAPASKRPSPTIGRRGSSISMSICRAPPATRPNAAFQSATRSNSAPA
jgi:hypothetical protein